MKVKKNLQMDKPTILVTAYAVNPYKGSEDATGWNMILQIARFQKVIAITRENNQEAIDRFLKENHVLEFGNIQFKYFDTPYYLRFWKKGGKGALLYFYLWQYSVAKWIKRNNFQFDIAHNLNFHNDWTPSFLWKTNKPLVWGPIGHHPAIPKQFLKPYGFSTMVRFSIRWVAKQLFWNLDPFLMKTKIVAKHIFAINTSVAKVLNLPESKISVLPAVATEEPAVFDKYPKDTFNILSVGRFEALKGFDITIRAFADFYHTLSKEEQSKVKLTLVGKGSSEMFLEEIINETGISNAVHIIPWIDREKLTYIYQGADLFFFPSHEGAGMVVAEAMSYGLPVLCFDNCGPGEFVNESCGVAIPYQKYNTTIHRFKEELIRLYEDREYILRLSKGAYRQYKNRFTWNTKGEIFKTVYESILYEQGKLVPHESNKEDYIYTSI
jgi:glycosyltransferase involved in cell wall biosynthesis